MSEYLFKYSPNIPQIFRLNIPLHIVVPILPKMSIKAGSKVWKWRNQGVSQRALVLTSPPRARKIKNYIWYRGEYLNRFFLKKILIFFDPTYDPNHNMLWVPHLSKVAHVNPFHGLLNYEVCLLRSGSERHFLNMQGSL